MSRHVEARAHLDMVTMRHRRGRIAASAAKRRKEYGAYRARCSSSTHAPVAVCFADRCINHRRSLLSKVSALLTTLHGGRIGKRT